MVGVFCWAMYPCTWEIRVCAWGPKVALFLGAWKPIRDGLTQRVGTRNGTRASTGETLANVRGSSAVRRIFVIRAKDLRKVFTVFGHREVLYT